MRVSVLLKGTLRGMDRESECELVAKRVPASEPGRYEYTDIAIIRAPADFHDGDYTLIFEGIVAPARHRGILWSVGPTLRQAAVPSVEDPAEFTAGVLRETTRLRPSAARRRTRMGRNL